MQVFRQNMEDPAGKGGGYSWIKRNDLGRTSTIAYLVQPTRVFLSVRRSTGSDSEKVRHCDRWAKTSAIMSNYSKVSRVLLRLPCAVEVAPRRRAIALNFENGRNCCPSEME